MVKPSFYIKGIDKLEAEMNKVSKSLNTKEVKIFLDAARYIKEGIDRNIASDIGVQTGNLRRSTYAVALPPTTRLPVRAYAGIRQGRAPHAHLVELGHGGPQPAPPHEYFWPAVDNRMGPAMDKIEAGLGKAIIEA